MLCNCTEATITQNGATSAERKMRMKRRADKQTGNETVRTGGVWIHADNSMFSRDFSAA